MFKQNITHFDPQSPPCCIKGHEVTKSLLDGKPVTDHVRNWPESLACGNKSRSCVTGWLVVRA